MALHGRSGGRQRCSLGGVFTVNPKGCGIGGPRHPRGPSGEERITRSREYAFSRPTRCYRQPAANFWRKQLKSRTFSVGAAAATGSLWCKLTFRTAKPLAPACHPSYVTECGLPEWSDESVQPVKAER